jgi:hypothetical protein
MKTLLLLCASLALAVGCGSKGGDPAACSSAVDKGVETMMGSVKKRMESMNAPPDQIAKVADAGAKLKEVITKHCTDDKWSKEVIDCYGSATQREDLRACRAKLPKEQGDKLQADEMQVMSSMMGGMRGMMGHGMRPPGGGSGDMSGGMTPPAAGMAPPPAPAPTGSATAPAPAPAPAGSAH